MKNEMLNAFNMIYGEEKIKNTMFIESQKYMIIECESGYAYKVEYNNGNVITTCLNY